MGTSTRGRWGAALLAIATGALAVGTGPATPAQAAGSPIASGSVTGGSVTGGSPVRVEQASGLDPSPTKLVTVTCPGATSVFAAGVRVDGGGGGVVPTGMVPDPGLHAVTVAAAARTGYQGAWRLIAYAVCDVSTSPPVRVPATATGTDAVTVSCPGQTRLTGTGFRVQGPVDSSYVDEVSFGPGLQSMRVHAAGTGTPASITGYAICKPPTQPSGQFAVRVAATSGFDAGWPKSVAVGDPSLPRTVYGVGGAVEGGAGRVFLTALVPDPTSQNQAVAEAAYAVRLPAGQLAPAGRWGLAEDGQPEGDEQSEGSVTVFGILIGTFH